MGILNYLREKFGKQIDSESPITTNAIYRGYDFSRCEDYQSMSESKKYLLVEEYQKIIKLIDKYLSLPKSDKNKEFQTEIEEILTSKLKFYPDLLCMVDTTDNSILAQQLTNFIDLYEIILKNKNATKTLLEFYKLYDNAVVPVEKLVDEKPKLVLSHLNFFNSNNIINHQNLNVAMLSVKNTSKDKENGEIYYQIIRDTLVDYPELCTNLTKAITVNGLFSNTYNLGMLIALSMNKNPWLQELFELATQNEKALVQENSNSETMLSLAKNTNYPQNRLEALEERLQQIDLSNFVDKVQQEIVDKSNNPMIDNRKVFYFPEELDRKLSHKRKLNLIDKFNRINRLIKHYFNNECFYHNSLSKEKKKKLSSIIISQLEEYPELMQISKVDDDTLLGKTALRLNLFDVVDYILNSPEGITATTSAGISLGMECANSRYYKGALTALENETARNQIFGENNIATICAENFTRSYDSASMNIVMKALELKDIKTLNILEILAKHYYNSKSTQDCFLSGLDYVSPAEQVRLIEIAYRTHADSAAFTFPALYKLKEKQQLATQKLQEEFAEELRVFE